MINFYHIPIKRKRQDVLAGKTNLRFISELISQLRILVKKEKKKTYSCVHDLTNRFVSSVRATILKIAVGVGERK